MVALKGDPVKPASDINDVKLSLSSFDNKVGVLGTGNFGKAIVSKLVSSGVNVIWGSRSPGTDQVPVETVMSENMLIMAVPVFSWSQLPLDMIQSGTIVIDCSNRQQWCQDGDLSQAEQLQHLLPPGVAVVKCFNTVSAYELENPSFSAGKQVIFYSTNCVLLISSKNIHCRLV